MQRYEVVVVASTIKHVDEYPQEEGDEQDH